MNRSTPGLPVHHQLPESTQTHVHWVGWCHPTISASVVPFSSLPSIFPSIRVFSNELALHIRCQSIGVSASTSVLPMNTQDWSPLGWTGWISLQSKGLWRVFSNTTVQKSPRFYKENVNPHMTDTSSSLISTEVRNAETSLDLLK